MAIASFVSKRNHSKGRCFLVLYHRRFIRGIEEGMAVRELANQSGVSYDYTSFRVRNWHELGYLSKKIKVFGSRAVFSYSATAKLKRYVEVVIPPDIRNRLLIDIRISRQLPAGIPETNT